MNNYKTNATFYSLLEVLIEWSEWEVKDWVHYSGTHFTVSVEQVTPTLHVLITARDALGRTGHPERQADAAPATVNY